MQPWIFQCMMLPTLPPLHSASTAAHCVRLRNLAAVQQFQRVTCSIYYLQNVLHKQRYKERKTGPPSKMFHALLIKVCAQFSVCLYDGCSHKCDILCWRQQQVTASVPYNATQLVLTKILHSILYIGREVKLLRQECLCFCACWRWQVVLYLAVSAARGK